MVIGIPLAVSVIETGSLALIYQNYIQCCHSGSIYNLKKSELNQTTISAPSNKSKKNQNGVQNGVHSIEIIDDIEMYTATLAESFSDYDMIDKAMHKHSSWELNDIKNSFLACSFHQFNDNLRKPKIDPSPELNSRLSQALISDSSMKNFFNRNNLYRSISKWDDIGYFVKILHNSRETTLFNRLIKEYAVSTTHSPRIIRGFLNFDKDNINDCKDISQKISHTNRVLDLSKVT